MVWLMILIAYAAPDDAVNWNGPWTAGVAHVTDERFRSQAECRNAAIQAIGRIHQAMLAPIRFRCVPVEATLPVGAAR
jgi:hypothetical protein